MNKKLRQVTDSIHDTIYLSEFESLLISTPYFYRLHDIYQSSTVYMTFPSNRTKRYEHSLGTMELASRMFFSAVANSDKSIRNELMGSLYGFINRIVTRIRSGDIDSIAYCKNEKKYFRSLFSFDDIKSEKDIKEKIDTITYYSIKNSVINDLALDHRMLCFFDSLENPKNENDVKKASQYLYIYQCILEAIRISALFHDVGHPPYSHIIENVLKEIYNECKEDNKQKTKKVFNHQKSQELVNDLKPFIDVQKDSIPDQLSFKSKHNPHLEFHEKVGVKMFQLAVENIFPSLMKSILDSDECQEYKTGKALYYITVVEFVFSIFLEKNILFKSLHRIIDGPLDADRLDYIVRDSKNSGINWGNIPYKRIIDSVIFTHPHQDCKSFYAITFPQKITDDIEDILITRYKIYVRINFHHRSIKTATILQTAVKKLSYEYLTGDVENKPLCREIACLWTSLGATLSDQSLQVIQWNDSWLITILYKSLVKLNNNQVIEDLTKQKGINQLEIQTIKNLLEELLLNKKHYYSLLKRKCDMCDLVKEICEKAGITDETIAFIKEKERLAYKEDENHKTKTMESLRRLEILERAKNDGDDTLFNTALKNIFSYKVLECALEAIKTSDEGSALINNYMLLENKGREKTGLPKDGENTDIDKNIYLYTNSNKVYQYSPENSLEPKLKALKASCLSFYVFIELKSTTNSRNTLKCIWNMLVIELSKISKNEFESLFSL